ncbi:MAG TPA: T9SS type A sorting domain-containing protein [Bacteroidales bacterium]|nr:T9SS type A sorting domain-containing protein [Bacteroidales bacterium]HPS16115.1 T9SS type A sorting domain-containing protein [Bacteroidales bacterium]
MKNKKIYFLILNLFISINLFSQPYESIYGKKSTEWAIFSEGFTTYETNTFTICCDTTINSKPYNKIVLINSNNCLSPQRCYFISEDTTSGKVWFYDSGLEKEYLVMDLSLNIGDTFKLNPYAFYPQADSIAIVDSVYSKNGNKIIRINYLNHLPANQEKLTFIEGVGPNFSVLFQANYYIYNPPRQLLCASKDGKYVYKNKINISSFEDTCFYVIVNIKETNVNTQIKTFPNPLKEELNINFSEPYEGDFIIYNSLGCIEKNESLKNTLNYRTDIRTLKKGIYYIQFLNNKISIIKKIVIQ